MEKEGLQELAEALPPSCSPVVHIEVCQKHYSTLKASVLIQHVNSMLVNRVAAFDELILTDFSDSDPVLVEHAVMVSVVDLPIGIKYINFSTMKLAFHVYQLHKEGPVQEEIEEEGDVPAATHWLLPNTEFHGLWENLVYDTDIKPNLLSYVETMLHFSDKGRSKLDIMEQSGSAPCVTGPPGTGKTSLCKALAQKLCIRLSARYSYGQLVEINSHSLFSKWFSESGKLVQKLFSKIQELVSDPDALVCVLIDEVESLTAARKAAMSGNEPSDAIRVVNALLTQIDQIKRHANVVILTTSNVTGAIDLAFVDRADIKQFIGLPSTAAIFTIYHSCINELMRVKIISPTQQILPLRSLEAMNFIENEATQLSLKLMNIACKSVGLSGRTLRKLPFLTHALYIQTLSVSLEGYLDTLDKTVLKQFKERKELTESN